MQYSSDMGRLKSVIVHSPKEEIFKVVTLTPEDHSAGPQDYMRKDAFGEHKAFVKVLRDNDIKVLEFSDLLNKSLETISSSAIPEVIKSRLKKTKNFDANFLLGASDESFYNTEHGKYLSPVFPPQKWLFFCRDFAAATPKGIVLCNFVNQDRYLEPYLAKIIFQNHPDFKNIPIVFDAPQEEVYLQGGDIIVGQDNTIFVGVNNLTEKKSAQKIAQKLDCRVIAINLPRSIKKGKKVYEHFSNVNLLFLHLDTVF